MNLSQFIKECCTPMFESVRIRDLDKARTLIQNYLAKRRIYTMSNIGNCVVDGKKGFYVQVFNENNEGACFYWVVGDTASIAGVGFVSNFNEFNVAMANPKSTIAFDVYVESKGTNIVQMCKLVERVLTGKVRMNQADIRQEIIGAQLFESAEEGILEESDDSYIDDLKRKKSNLYMRIRSWNRKGKDVSELQAEYEKITKEYNDAKVSVRSKVVVQSSPDNDIEDANDNFFEEVRATPEERFDDMKNYIYNVVTGLRPLALLCGAPGVGKTYRVMQIVKGLGKEHGKDYKLLKGKTTPAALYMALHDYKEPGQLLIMDDCDSVFKDPDAVNLLKAAFDSSDERWVTWGISTGIPMSQEQAEMCDDAVYDEAKNRWFYPKEMLYQGSGVIITNYSAGQIDTAVRNRALICDLSFTTDEVLEIIRGIAPKIMPDQLSEESKMRALDYLQELADKKAPVELSIRSFSMCALMYNSNCPEKQIRRMIAEQMRLQFMKFGRKY